jgi:IMP dehydrogenase
VEFEIGIGKTARRAYGFDEVAIVPSRRTRDPEDVSIKWEIDAYTFELPMMASAMDAAVSPDTAVEIGRVGGLACLNLEGLWTRYEDPESIYDEIGALPDEKATRRMQELYAEPVKDELIGRRIEEIKRGGVVSCASLTPQRVEKYAPAILEAGLDILVIQGTVVSAEHVSSRTEPLNLKQFIARFDLPVIVGGVASYQTALHLMRTGAAGVIVGVGADSFSTGDAVMGIRVPLASAIADAAAARRDYLDETGGRYVHVIANGRIETSGAIARALACGADAVQLGEPLRIAAEVPGGGIWWDSVAAHPRLPRGGASPAIAPAGSLQQVLLGPAETSDGRTNLFGALRRTMAKTGYRDLKEFQRVDLVIGGHVTGETAD